MVAGSFFSGSSNRETRMANAGPSTPIKNYGGNMGFQEDFGAGRVNNVRPKPGVSIQDVYGVAPVKKVEKEREENKYRKIAQGDTSPYSNEGYNKWMNENYGTPLDSRRYKNFPNYLKQDLRDSYKDDVDAGRFDNNLSSIGGETLIASAGPLSGLGINTSATTKVVQMGNVSSTEQRARDAVAKSNLRKSGLDKTVGGRSSQANYGRSRKGWCRSS